MNGSMAIINLQQVASTNTWAKEHATTLSHGDIVAAVAQTSGRGQRGNSWEAEPGKNMTCSIMLQPANILPACQFLISEIVALSVADTVEEAITKTGVPQAPPVTVKWPNDIYAGNRKIAGILIEHTLCGNRIAYTIAGIGLNVNQEFFQSDAPNPVSLLQLTGMQSDIETLMQAIRDKIMARLQSKDASGLHRLFISRMWRNDGAFHRFQRPNGEIFMGRIVSVATSGELSLTLSDGHIETFAFKEVGFVL